MRAFAIILAAGRGERFGSDKVLQELGGRPVWKWSYDVFRSMPEISGVGIVCSESNIDAIRSWVNAADFIVTGGETRQESCRIGVMASPEDADAILVQDAARPFITREVVRRVLEGIEEVGAAAPTISVPDTLRERTPVGSTVLSRERIVAMQTPQGARRDAMLDAHDCAKQLFTDEMALLENAGYDVKMVQGSHSNFKITTSEDWERALSMVGRSETRN